MSSRSSAPAIPAWQRAQQPMQSDTEASPKQQSQDANATDKDAPGAEDSTSEDSHQEVAVEEQPSNEEATLSAEERSRQTDTVKKFLEDPGVKDEPVEKKREFLESKGIAKEMIDQELGTTSSPSAPSASDFANFKEITPTSRPSQPPRAAGPPIITYPEFLEDARKPPPLITPTRVLNATYLASGIAAIAYGASTFLIKPMAASLTDARHDFAAHNQSKIDEFNERISKLVSKIPELKSASDEADEDTESVASDPTELFHRDIGTQTSPAITPLPTAKASTEMKTTADKQNDRLTVIKSHLDEILAGVQAGEQPAKDRMDETNKLRHQLDNMMFRVQTANAWGGFGIDQKAASETEDGIEELKKEIRGVKGVLLSAKRFAPVAPAPAPGRFGT
ncbi:hypothetical protein Q7P37_002532 [Cladosporium fusiforme]